MAKSFSIFKFLLEALVLPSKNPKLFTQLFLISAISRVFLVVSNYLLTQHVNSELIEISKNLSTIDPKSSEYTNLAITITKDTTQLLILQIVKFFFLFVLSFIIYSLAYYSSSSIYLGEILTLKKVFKKFKTNIKGPLITRSIIVLFDTFYWVLFGAINFCFAHSSTVSFCDTFILLYLSIIWSTAIAISVLETDKYGLTAISHAMKLLKGRKMQILALVLVSTALSNMAYGFNYIIWMFVPHTMNSTISLRVIFVIFEEGLALYTIWAITILYYECSHTCEEENIGKVLYSVVSTHEIALDEDV